ncbi:MAG: asparagine synthase (glutamine-hydrolyzing) [Lewinellaceae bacterium]|nr:asparagine synthase (glutamine-hydrolyzing) [Saprospiraceae bacterium]MCB9338350.1 asparagine synthase (glutamine-hydrolyzing) [Lewinellaceae bacterium]
MCGIAGIVWQNNQEQKQAAIRRMTDAIAHRGPNADGHFVNQRVALGHRRLSIIDLSPEANQPFWDSSDRYVIVFNGEVYNFQEIRKKLSNYTFRTKCDTEVILAAYIQWGEKCLDHFAGMFAFAVWDTWDNKLFIARDRLGIKPLYYVEKNGMLLFASEIRALLASGLVEKKLNKKGLYNYLNYQTVHAPNTMVEEVKQLNPGEFATLQHGVLTIKKYWELAGNGQSGSPAVGGPSFDNYEEVKKNVRRLMLQAVERRLIADVPLGAFLSGGIDSSAIVALMAEVSERPVETFSVVFEEKQFDESEYSDLIAKLYKTNHHPLLLKPTDFLDALPAALKAMDAPSGDGVNTYVVSKVTKEAGITVALSGTGGDELFAGYSLFTDYWKLNQHPYFWKIPRGVRTAGASMAGLFLKSHQKARVSEIASARSAAIEDVYPAFRKVLTSREIGKMMLNGEAANGKTYDAVYDLLKEQRAVKKLPLLSQLTVADISTYTQNVLLRDTDQMSMAHALEVRVPFFDHDLVEYVVQIPDKWKYPTFAKKLLVESLHPLIPDEIVFRQKKGFDLPWKVWIKQELKSFCEQKLKRFNERNLTPPSLTDQLWRDFTSGKNDNLWSRIWIFVVLEDWLDRMGVDG